MKGGNRIIMENKNFKHEYICSTNRLREDEEDVIWRTNKEYKKGDWFTDSEGLKWQVRFINY